MSKYCKGCNVDKRSGYQGIPDHYIQCRVCPCGCVVQRHNPIYGEPPLKGKYKYDDRCGSHGLNKNSNSRAPLRVIQGLKSERQTKSRPPQVIQAAEYQCNKPQNWKSSILQLPWKSSVLRLPEAHFKRFDELEGYWYIRPDHRVKLVVNGNGHQYPTNETYLVPWWNGQKYEDFKNHLIEYLGNKMAPIFLFVKDAEQYKKFKKGFIDDRDTCEYDEISQVLNGVVEIHAFKCQLYDV